MNNNLTILLAIALISSSLMAVSQAYPGKQGQYSNYLETEPNGPMPTGSPFDTDSTEYHTIVQGNGTELDLVKHDKGYL